MKILMKNSQRILKYKLSPSEIGLYFIIRLMNDSNPKITAAKVFAVYKRKEILMDLMRLHEVNVISWSGYKAAKKKIEATKPDPRIQSILTYYNDLCNKKCTADSVKTSIRARLEDYTEEQIKSVISNRYVKWKDDKVMSDHLKMQTLMRPSKFAKYFDEFEETRVGESLIQANKVNLKDGDEITLELSKTLIDREVYHITSIEFKDGVQKKKINSSRVGSRLKILILGLQRENQRDSSRQTQIIYRSK